MPYVVAIGHRLSLRDLLDKFNFEDLDEAESALEEAGLTIFTNNSDDVFVVNIDKYKIIERDIYVDLDFTLTSEEEKILKAYTGHSDKRVKLFWIEPEEEEIPVEHALFLKSFLDEMNTEDATLSLDNIVKNLEEVKTNIGSV